MLPDKTKEKLAHIPTQPGVYLMKDAKGMVIYVGKAKSLRHRIHSYFQITPNRPPKIEQMVSRIRDFECIVTSSELEALILESNLIKQLKPKYNVRIKDDKNFPYIKITIDEEYPRLFIVRKIEADKACYFGPYVPSRAIKTTLSLIRKIFPVRLCHKKLDKKAERPCLNYQIKKCLGPCVQMVSAEEYREIVNQLILFLSGKRDDLVDDLKKKMDFYADQLEFEKAARVRDQLFDVERALEKQKIISAKFEDQDIFAFSEKGGHILIEVFHIRLGKLVGRTKQILRKVPGMEDEEVLSSFITQFYRPDTLIPKEIVLPMKIKEEELIQEWLSQKRGANVTLTVPKRGRKKELLEMVNENIQHWLKLELDALSQEKKAVEKLSKALKINIIPSRIECYDISNIQGTLAVGSMVVWCEGEMRNSQYRHFKIRSSTTPDDYLMLSEVLRRRFSGSLASKTDLPDLIIVDGGKGQLNIALMGLRELNLDNIPVIAIAKSEQGDQIFIPGRKNPLNLNRYPEVLNLLAKIRDEAHRFAISYHRLLREKALKKSILDEIPGIGTKRRKTLLNHFGSLKKIREATLEQLLKVKGLDKRAANAVYNFFKKEIST